MRMRRARSRSHRWVNTSITWTAWRWRPGVRLFSVVVRRPAGRLRILWTSTNASARNEFISLGASNQNTSAWTTRRRFTVIKQWYTSSRNYYLENVAQFHIVYFMQISFRITSAVCSCIRLSPMTLSSFRSVSEQVRYDCVWFRTVLLTRVLIRHCKISTFRCFPFKAMMQLEPVGNRALQKEVGKSLPRSDDTRPNVWKSSSWNAGVHFIYQHCLFASSPWHMSCYVPASISMAIIYFITPE